MKAGRTALALLLIATATAGLLTAEDSDADTQITVWLYYENGALYDSRTASAGDTLADVLAGDYPAAKYWLDICTGYEWPKDRPMQ